MENAPHSEVQKPVIVEKEKKRTSRKEWFKRGISTLIAVVTVLGAYVAWRAQVAGSESGDLEAEGLQASHSDQEVRNRIIIEIAEHYTAYLDFLSNRKLAFSALQDLSNGENLTTEQEEKIYKDFVGSLDLAATTKRYFFPGRYLSYDESGETYDYIAEYNELYAAQQRDRDLDAQKSFERSDSLSEKVMALLGVLVVLAISLWLLALSEVLGTATRYATGVGGALFLILGAYGVYSIENSTGPPSGTTNLLWFFSYILGGLTLAGSVLLFVLSLVRRPKAAAIQPAAYNPNMPPQPPQLYYPAGDVNAPTAPYIPNQGQQNAPIPTNIAPVQAKAEEEAEEAEEPFKKLITILIATVALIASVIAFLQSDAGNQESSANRSVQVDSVSILGTNIFGAAATSFDYGAAVRIWKELDTESKTAETFGDPAQAARYANARDAITQISPVFTEQYFDPKSEDVPKRYSYDADIYQRDVAGLNEKATIQAKLKNDWDAKASAYIAHLTLLAVSLALLGLSLAVSGFVRYIFAGAGVVMVIITLVWAVGIYNQPIKSLNLDAVDAYARGEGLWLSDKTEDAIKEYDESLSIEPGYTSALYSRGRAHSYLAYLAFGKQDYEQSDKEYQLAVDDYLAAIAAGKDDTTTNWSLGWIYYLQGKYDDAIRVDTHIEEIDPTVIGPRLNRALALLVQGKYDESELMYNTAIAKVADQVNDAIAGDKLLDKDFWYYLDAGVTDLDNLIDRIDGREYYYTEAPTVDKIASPEDTRDRALDIILNLKSSTAGFEFQGKPPTGESTAVIGNFTFKAVDPASEDSEPVEWENNYLPYNTKTVKVGFDYSGIEEGQRVLFKLYKENVEQKDYRQYVTWPNLDASGQYEFDVADPAAQFRDSDFNPEADSRLTSLADYSGLYTFPSGDYIVELYIDDHLLRRGFFQVEYPPAAAPSPDATPTP